MPFYPKMPLCVFRIRPNSLLSIWYCLGSALLQGWLLFLAFERYRLYTEMQWPTGAFPRLWLTVYISLLGSCIPLLALFLAFGLLRSGNLAADNERLGARTERTIELVKGGPGQTAVRLRQSKGYCLLSKRQCHLFFSFSPLPLHSFPVDPLSPVVPVPALAARSHPTVCPTDNAGPALPLWLHQLRSIQKQIAVFPPKSPIKHRLPIARET